jgi:CheY-like chemotaxis protein
MKRILVIEDNESNIYLTSFIFEKSGYRIIVSRKGAVGAELAIKEKPDLILMDLQLPDISGIEATKRIRASEAGRDIPIIAITSFGLAGEREKVLAAGCTSYYVKPINPQTIIAEAEKYL